MFFPRLQYQIQAEQATVLIVLLFVFCVNEWREEPPSSMSTYGQQMNYDMESIQVLRSSPAQIVSKNDKNDGYSKQDDGINSDILVEHNQIDFLPLDNNLDNSSFDIDGGGATSATSTSTSTSTTKGEGLAKKKKEQNESSPLLSSTNIIEQENYQEEINFQDEKPTSPTLSPLFYVDVGPTNDTFWSATTFLTRDMEILQGKHAEIPDESMCDTIRNKLNRTKSDAILLLNRTNDKSRCKDLVSGVAGSGNVVLEIVAQRLGALAENHTALIFDCGFDANTYEARRSQILPWISGYFPPSMSFDQNHPPLDMVIPTEYCPSRRRTRRDQSADTSPTISRNQKRRRLYNSMPLKFMKPLVSYDLRRMAIALVGVKDPDHPSAVFEQQYLFPEANQPPFTPIGATGGTIYKVPIHDYVENGPLFPNVELDDVVIHYRCGDILLPGAPGPFYFPKFEEYTKLISPEAKSVGIVTQPFSSNDPASQIRKRDKTDESGARCRVLVEEGLVQYIEDKLEGKRVRIHNGPDETVALAYARMVMANQTLSLFPSTFSSMPTLASFGTGYVTQPTSRKFANSWLNHELTQDLFSDQPVQVPIFNNMLYANHLKDMWQYGDDFVLEWFRNASIPPGPRTPSF